MVQDVILIRGAPGTGKSSIARHLARHFLDGVTLEVDDIRGNIRGLDWEDEQAHFDAISAAAEAVRALVRRGSRPVLFVDTLGYGRLQFALAALGTATSRTYSLVTSDAILALRLLLRTTGYRDVRNARKFNAHIREETDRFPVIDTTFRRPATIAAHIFLEEQAT